MLRSNWEFRWSDKQSAQWKLPLRHDGEVNLFDLHNRDIGHRVEQLGVKTRMSTTFDELQLRRIRSHLQCGSQKAS